MYTVHPQYIFVFNEQDYQANIWLNTDLFGESIDFISHKMTPLFYEVSPAQYNFKIFDRLDNSIILNAKNHDMIVQLFKSVKIGIIIGNTEAIKTNDKKNLKFTYASLI